MERTLVDTFKLIDNEKLLLPDFQRDYKWNSGKQQSLLASILLNFPVGSSLILKGNASDFALRKIGETTQFAVGHNDPCEYLLDGQQRTTTLYNAFNDIYDFSKFSTKDELSKFLSAQANPMKMRWFMRIPIADIVNEQVTDIFGARKLNFEKQNLDIFEPEEIIDVFSCETFNEKKNKCESKWFSPYYQLKQKSDQKSDPQVITQFVNDCIAEGVIPLFMIGSKPQYITRILNGIVEKNAQVIRDQYEQDFEYIKNNYDKDQLLDGYNSIEDFEESTGEYYQDKLDYIFTNCKNSWQNDVKTYLVKDVFESYELSSIVTDDIRRAIPIFCHLNDGGMKLDDFDLVAAKAAKKLVDDTKTYSMSSIVRNMFSEKVDLCETLKIDSQSLTGKLDLSEFDSLDDGLPSGYISSSILAICTALAQKDIDGKPDFNVKKKDTSSKTLLNLKTEQIRCSIQRATVAVQRAFAFLLIRCGVHNAKKLHYKLMIQPIAYLLAHDNVWNDQSALKKIEFWYWSSAFSGRYLYDQSTVVIEDINQLYDWVVNNNGNPILQRENNIFLDQKFCSKELLTQKLDDYPKESIRTLILQYVLSLGSYDLLEKETESLKAFKINNQTGDVLLRSDDDESGLNDHHIIPLGIATGLGQNTDVIRDDQNHILNSPLNRVFISAKANNAIRAMDPSRYFSDIPKNNIVIQSLLIGQLFKGISTKSTEQDILNALEERFELLKSSVQSELLQLRT